MKEVKICEFCGDDFIAIRNKQKYCSKECCYEADKLRKRWERKIGKPDFPEQICIVCGNKFKPKRSDQITCGGECSKRHNVDINLDKIRAYKQARKKPLEPKKCIICNKVFMPTSHKQKLCGSPECKRLRTRELDNIKVKKKYVPKPKTGPTLAELAAEARAHGMNYGEYIATIEGGMKV